MRSIMEAGSASACGDRIVSSTPAGEIRCSQRTVSVLPSRATWNRLKRDCGLFCLCVRRISPYRKHPKYSGFLALYVHYLYLLGKIEKRQYPPRMTPHLRQAVMRFEQYQAQFAFLRENDITTLADMAAFEQRTEETLGRLTKQRTLLNVRKKKRQPLYAALADAEALEPSRALYEEGLTGMEQEFEQYMKAVKLLEDSGIPQEVLKKEKAELYE